MHGRRPLSWSLAGGWLLLVAAGPAEPGLELSGSLGGQAHDRLLTYGCAGPQLRYRLAGPFAHGELRQTGPKGWTAAGAASVSPTVVLDRTVLDWGEGEVESDWTVPAPGAWHTVGAVAARGGFHWRYAGGEVGPAVIWLWDDEPRALPWPSVGLWVGKPDTIYVFGGLLREPLWGPADSLFSAGVGHRAENMRGELAFLPAVDTGGVDLSVKGTLPVADDLWAGGQLFVRDVGEERLQGMLALTLTYQRPASGP